MTVAGARRGRRALLLGVAAGVACQAPPPATAPRGTVPRAIVVSFDSFNEGRVVGTLPASRIPAIRALFAEGACAEGAQPAFPSVTAAGHASLWTGTYGDRHGIAANAHLRLPAPRHGILDLQNGFGAAGLRAEPIWITAGGEGLSVVGHHVTQAPGPPGYPVDDGEPPDTFRVARARAERVLAAPHVAVFNGYNRAWLAPRLVTGQDLAALRGEAWAGLVPTAGEVDIALRLPLGGDPAVAGRALHLLLRLWPAADSGGLLAAFTPSVRGAVRVVPHAEERAPARGRALARYFSAPVTLRLPDGVRASLRLRLFDLRARDSTFTLFVPGLQLAEANRPELTAAYDSAIGGWVGNSALGLWERGALGRTMLEGGDGLAELRWLESAELLTRNFMDGASWAWQSRHPRLLLDYFPLGDDADHALWGELDPTAPGHDPARASGVAAVRGRLWELVDLRLSALMALARQSPGTRLFVAGDHGMRSAWRRFRPNAALRAAGLLAVDSGGRIDLSRSRAASGNGYWISVNRVGRLGGTVAPGAVEGVLDSVRAALLAVRDAAGEPVVTRVVDRRDPQASAWGIGGAAGGDVYYDLAPGYMWSAEAAGAVTQPLPRAKGEHGFPSDAPDMRTVACAWGAGVRPGREAGVRPLAAVAPRVLGWLRGVTSR